MALKNHIMWWDSLTPVDKNSPRNINRLVMLGEEIRQSEIGSWSDASRHETEHEDMEFDELEAEHGDGSGNGRGKPNTKRNEVWPKGRASQYQA
jgi:hypothetical protein